MNGQTDAVRATAADLLRFDPLTVVRSTSVELGDSIDLYLAGIGSGTR